MDNKNEIEKLILEIAEKIRINYHPDAIILFGSYAYGSPAEDSDIDMLIVKDTPERSIDRRVTVSRLVSDPIRLVPFEPLVITPKELTHRLELGDQFLEEIISRGKVLYAKKGILVSQGLVGEGWKRP